MCLNHSSVCLLWIRIQQEVPSQEVLEQEMMWMQEHLSQLASPVVLSHNDLLCKNIIHNEKEGEFSWCTPWQHEIKLTVYFNNKSSWSHYVHKCLLQVSNLLSKSCSASETAFFLCNQSHVGGKNNIHYFIAHFSYSIHSYGWEDLFSVFEISLLCSLRLHLIKKWSKSCEILFCEIIWISLYILKCNLFL